MVLRADLLVLHAEISTHETIGGTGHQAWPFLWKASTSLYWLYYHSNL